jgi:hypothetical protein
MQPAGLNLCYIERTKPRDATQGLPAEELCNIEQAKLNLCYIELTKARDATQGCRQKRPRTPIRTPKRCVMREAHLEGYFIYRGVYFTQVCGQKRLS